jgi:predicted RNase H-like nuclease (RuvC/YqgF family)
MGFLGIGKKREVIDLTEYGNSQKSVKPVETKKQSTSNPFSFFDNPGVSNKTESDFVNFSESEERKKRLAKRIADMSSRIEELSNQVYRLQQRLEVLERKADVGI